MNSSASGQGLNRTLELTPAGRLFRFSSIFIFLSKSGHDWTRARLNLKTAAGRTGSFR
jgi:hypothetical protein